MRKIRLASALLAATAALALSACDGGSSVDNGGGSPIGSPAPTPAPGTAMSEADAVRLAKQASFGPTPELVAHIRSAGLDKWLNEQFVATGSTYADIAGSGVRGDFCNGDHICGDLHFTRKPVAMRFYADAVGAQDQLRQRVALALNETIVASEASVNNTAGMAALNQIFLANAFGNYRDILMAVTLNGYMGDYLDMVDSKKEAPSENYARELLQLFSMGTDQLNMDGTPRLDSSGATIPTYSQEDVEGVSHALTGWTYARLGGAPNTDALARDYATPMVPAPAGRYDAAEKRFLGVTVPAGAPQQASVAAVVDAAFNNGSTPPFIAYRLIQALVTSNPTPGYVQRVASVFANNGAGVRGDMKAVVRAILTDAEARGDSHRGANDGKLKEPILLMTSLARAIGFRTDGYAFMQRDSNMGQPVLRSPSVFNFYPPDYPLPGSSTLRSPVSKLATTSNIVRWHNFVYDWTIAGDATRNEFKPNDELPLTTGSTPDWASWEALGTDTDAMIDRIDLVMLGRTMTDDQKAKLRTAAEAITDPVPATQARRRAQMLLYVVGTSPQFLVDR